MLDSDLIQRKLSQLTRYLDELAEVAKSSKTEFTSTPRHYQAERLLELLVGTALDINFHLIRERGLPAPTKYKDSFLALGKAKLLSEDLAKRLARSAGLRNLLVHHYDEVDLDKLYKGIRDGLVDYQAYSQAIMQMLEKSE